MYQSVDNRLAQYLVWICWFFYTPGPILKCRGHGGITSHKCERLFYNAVLYQLTFRVEQRCHSPPNGNAFTSGVIFFRAWKRGGINTRLGQKAVRIRGKQKYCSCRDPVFYHKLSVK